MQSRRLQIGCGANWKAVAFRKAAVPLLLGTETGMKM